MSNDASQKKGPDPSESLTSMDWLPRVNVGKGREDGKPPYSYASLITFAINSAKGKEKKLTLAEIYEWIQEHYPYFKSAGAGWKNSVRHNLSLNKLFRKVARDASDPGKGSYWMISDQPSGSSSSSKSGKRGKSQDSEPISKKSKTNTQSEGQTAALLDLAINTGADVDLATCLAANDIDLADPGAPRIENLNAFKDLNQSFSKLYASLKSAGPPEPTILPAVDTSNMSVPVSSAADVDRLIKVEAPPVITFDTIQAFLDNVDSDPSLKSAIDVPSFNKTQELAKNVASDQNLGFSWISSPHFANLALSFNQLMSSNNLFGSVDWTRVPTQSMNGLQGDIQLPPLDPAVKPSGEEEEDEFDWDTMVNLN